MEKSVIKKENKRQKAQELSKGNPQLCNAKLGKGMSFGLKQQLVVEYSLNRRK